ncbi:hypothetical protein ACWPM1_05765 [Tsuneonella sp. HG249]
MPGSGRPSATKADYRKVTNEALFARLDAPMVRPVIYRGRMTAITAKSENSTLFRLLRRLDAVAARAGAEWQ